MSSRGGGGVPTAELGTFPSGESFQKSASCPWKEGQNLPRPHRRKEILRYFYLIGFSRGIFQKLPVQGCRAIIQPASLGRDSVWPHCQDHRWPRRNRPRPAVSPLSPFWEHKGTNPSQHPGFNWLHIYSHHLLGAGA